MIYYVYLILSKNKNQNYISYVGYTKNLSKRLDLHNQSKGAKFTRGRQWRMIYFETTKSIWFLFDFCLIEFEII